MCLAENFFTNVHFSSCVAMDLSTRVILCACFKCGVHFLKSHLFIILLKFHLLNINLQKISYSDWLDRISMASARFKKYNETNLIALSNLEQELQDFRS